MYQKGHASAKEENEQKYNKNKNKNIEPSEHPAESFGTS